MKMEKNQKNDSEIEKLSTNILTIPKKKRVDKACDSCRFKKKKCDGKKPCNQCLIYNKICVYVEKRKKKTYPYGYVELLETRIEILTKSFEKLIELSIPHLKFLSELIYQNQCLDEIKKNNLEKSCNITQNEKNPFIIEPVKSFSQEKGVNLKCNLASVNNEFSKVKIPINIIIFYLIESQNLKENLPENWKESLCLSKKLKNQIKLKTFECFSELKNKTNNESYMTSDFFFPPQSKKVNTIEKSLEENLCFEQFCQCEDCKNFENNYHSTNFQNPFCFFDSKKNTASTDQTNVSLLQENNEIYCDEFFLNKNLNQSNNYMEVVSPIESSSLNSLMVNDITSDPLDLDLSTNTSFFSDSLLSDDQNNFCFKEKENSIIQNSLFPELSDSYQKLNFPKKIFINDYNS